MTTETRTETADAVPITGFLADLVAQVRAADTYGRSEHLSDEKVLAPYVLGAADRRAIPAIGDLNGVIEGRIRSFYQAVAAGIENATGVMTSYVLDLNHEGFGRVVLFAGSLVVLADTLRDAHRFGFPTMAKLSERGERFVRNGAAAIEKFPEAARA